MTERISVQYISRSDISEKLYDLEEKLAEAVRAVAIELAEVKKKAIGVEMDFYREAIPETLAMLCDQFSTDLELHRTE